MICFICKSEFLSLSALVVHFKVIHMLKKSSTYECTENQCSQVFSTLDSFKRHTQKHTNNVTKKIKINHNEKEIDDNTVIFQDINKDVNLHNPLKEFLQIQCET